MSEQKGKNDGDGGEIILFEGVTALFAERGIQPRRLQIWKQKLQQLGGVVEEHRSKRITHVFGATGETLRERIGPGKRKKNMIHLKYDWIEDCLKAGERLPTKAYILKELSEGEMVTDSVDDSASWDSTQGDCNSPSDRKRQGISKESDSAKRAKTQDWMQIIKNGGECGVVKRSPVGRAKKKEGENKGTQENSMEESSMEDAGCELSPPEISSSVLTEVREGVPNHPQFLKNEPELGYTPPNLNSNITGPFTEIRDIYKDALGDDRRYFSYYKALSVLEKVPFKISSVDQIKGLPTLGKSLLDNIQEILTTGRFSKLEHLKNDGRVRAISLLGSVWGIGPATAQKLYDKGHRSLEDLKTDDSLTPAQRTGLEFHFDIIKKIPRHEITVMEALVQKAAEEIRPNISVLCGGSYRRGKAMSGDIDFVITHPDGHSHTGVMNGLLRKLKTEGFLTEDLMHGPNTAAREQILEWTHILDFAGTLVGSNGTAVDFKIYPFDQYPFGLIAWTGNDVLNRRLRLLAEANGYKLDDHGLYPVVRDAHGNRVKSTVSVPCKSEREVFEKLGFPWLEPHERNL